MKALFLVSFVVSLCSFIMMFCVHGHAFEVAFSWKRLFRCDYCQAEALRNCFLASRTSRKRWCDININGTYCLLSRGQITWIIHNEKLHKMHMKCEPTVFNSADCTDCCLDWKKKCYLIGSCSIYLWWKEDKPVHHTETENILNVCSFLHCTYFSNML